MIAVSLKNKTELRQALSSGADLLELRNDYFTLPELEHLLARSTLSVILTLKRSIPSTTVIKLLNVYHPRYLDIDYRQKHLLKQIQPLLHRRTQIIVSYHDYHKTPTRSAMQKIVQKLWRLKPDIIKVATTIRTIDDVVVIKRLQANYGKKCIAIGMGELGLMTRVYNRGLLTFASVHTKTTTAPGQLTVAATRTTQLYGLIGDDIAQSLSPQLHNTAFRQHHLPYRYQLWQTNNLAAVMELFQFFCLPGASVTKPYKRAVMEYCTRLDRAAKTIGAVNTLVRRGQNIIGYNTDWIGVQQALKGRLRHKVVLILGTGGAAAACAYASKQAGAQSVMCLPHATLPTVLTDWDVVINATPVTQQLLVPATALKNKIVMDCIYQTPTILLRTARRHHAKFMCDGLPMLRHQAAEQFRLWA